MTQEALTVLEPLLALAVRVAGAFAVLLVGRWLARRSRAALEHALLRTKLSPSMVRLVCLLAYYAILLVALITALAMLGVPVATSIIVLLLALVVLGIALQQSIANLTATIVFMVFDPFHVGELIETNDMIGTVREIQLLGTVIVTGDNKVVTVPNGRIQSETLINYSRLGTLRVELTFTVNFQSDVELVTQTLRDLMASDGRVLADPAPTVFVKDLGDNGMRFAIRPWVRVGDYWDIQTDFPGKVKSRFDSEGITIALPQREVRQVASPAGGGGEARTGSADT